jgi:FtsH-binding integral membrane protein
VRSSNDTSNILHRYRTDQYVGASLALFASIALLFWYVLRLWMRLRDSYLALRS